jgi:hypothetical protein
MYQLNKTQRVPGKFYDSVKRIMEMNPESRIDIIVRATTNFRKYLKKYTQK